MVRAAAVDSGAQGCVRSRARRQGSGSGSGGSSKRRLQHALGVGDARLGPVALRDRGAGRTGELR